MNKNSINDKTSFEVFIHAEDHPKVFVCDKPITPVIAVLNKKGGIKLLQLFWTLQNRVYEYFDEEIRKLKEYQQDERIIIKR